MLCVEWWSFVVGIFLMGKYICILIVRKEEKQRLFHGKSARTIFNLQVANHKKTNDRANAVNKGVSMYFMSVSMYLNSYIDNRYVIQY